MEIDWSAVEQVLAAECQKLKDQLLEQRRARAKKLDAAFQLAINPEKLKQAINAEHLAKLGRDRIILRQQLND